MKKIPGLVAKIKHWVFAKKLYKDGLEIFCHYLYFYGFAKTKENSLNLLGAL